MPDQPVKLFRILLHPAQGSVGQARLIVNVEQNATGQIAGLIREYTGLACGRSLLKYDGRQMTGEEIAQRVKKEGF